MMKGEVIAKSTIFVVSVLAFAFTMSLILPENIEEVKASSHETFIERTPSHDIFTQDGMTILQVVEPRFQDTDGEWITASPEIITSSEPTFTHEVINNTYKVFTNSTHIRVVNGDVDSTFEIGIFPNPGGGGGPPVNRTYNVIDGKFVWTVESVFLDSIIEIEPTSRRLIKNITITDINPAVLNTLGRFDYSEEIFGTQFINGKLGNFSLSPLIIYNENQTVIFRSEWNITSNSLNLTLTKDIFNDLPVYIDPDLIVDGTTTTLSGNVTFDTVIVKNSGIIDTTLENGTASSGSFNLTATVNITIESGAKIDVSAQGNEGGAGGACSNSNADGGDGGIAGTGAGGLGGNGAEQDSVTDTSGGGGGAGGGGFASAGAVGGGGGAGSIPGGGGAAGTAGTPFGNNITDQYPTIGTGGAGGGGGGGATGGSANCANGATGARGGGGVRLSAPLIFVADGGNISSIGGVGGNGGDGEDAGASGGGGGGGGAGATGGEIIFVALTGDGTITMDGASINATGGTGGTGGPGGTAGGSNGAVGPRGAGGKIKLFYFTFNNASTVIDVSGSNVGNVYQEQQVAPNEAPTLTVGSNNTYNGETLENDNTYIFNTNNFSIDFDGEDADADDISAIVVFDGTEFTATELTANNFSFNLTSQAGGNHDFNYTIDDGTETTTSPTFTLTINANTTSTNHLISADRNDSYINANETVELSVNVSSNETIDNVLATIETSGGINNYTLNGTTSNFTMLLDNINLGQLQENYTQINITTIYFNNTGTNFTSYTNTSSVSINFVYGTASISNVDDTPDPVSNSSGQTFTISTEFRDSENVSVTSGCSVEIFSTNTSLNYNAGLDRHDAIISSEQSTGIHPYRIICDGNTSYQNQVDTSGEITLSSGGGSVGGGTGGGGGGGGFQPTEVTTSVNLTLGRSIFAVPGQQRLIEIDITNDKKFVRNFEFSASGTFKDWVTLDTIDGRETLTNVIKLEPNQTSVAGILITVPENVEDANYIIVLNFKNQEEETATLINLEVIVRNQLGFGIEILDFLTQKLTYPLIVDQDCEASVERGLCFTGAQEFNFPALGVVFVGSAFVVSVVLLRRYFIFFKKSPNYTAGMSLVIAFVVLALIP